MIGALVVPYTFGFGDVHERGDNFNQSYRKAQHEDADRQFYDRLSFGACSSA